MGQRWKEEENSIIREGYENGLPISKIAIKLPHRSKHSIEMQLWKLGLTTKRGGITPWTEEENHIIREGHKKNLTHRQIAEKLENRTPKAVQAQAGKLGLLANPSIPWTKEENDIIKYGYNNSCTLKEIASKLPGRTEKAVGMQAFKLGLCHKDKKTVWSQEEVDVLIEGLQKGLSVAQISKKLPNRTKQAISMRIIRLKKKKGSANEEK